MPTENAFVEEVVDLLGQFSEVSSRKMFGGYGIFHAGLMFALIADNELFLKADKQSVHFFENSDCPPFSYSRAGGKEYKMSYYRVPEAFFEDPEQTQLWSKRAQDAALRAPRKKQNKTKQNKTQAV